MIHRCVYIEITCSRKILSVRLFVSVLERSDHSLHHKQVHQVPVQQMYDRFR